MGHTDYHYVNVWCLTAPGHYALSFYGKSCVTIIQKWLLLCTIKKRQQMDLEWQK